MKSMKMKAMKAMKSGMKKMGSMKRMKAMKVSKVAGGRFRKSVVWRGSKEKTSGGLKKGDLMKNKDGKIVSKKLSANGKKLYAKHGAKWMNSVAKARKALGIKGFC